MAGAKHAETMQWIHTHRHSRQAKWSAHSGESTAPVYDLVHPEFLKHLGPKALAWLANLFTRMVWERRIPKIWRQAKILALAKPGKKPTSCCKLLAHITA